MTAALVSLACRYPDAATPEALWQNVLEGRRSFRSIPPERIELARYAATVVGEADSIVEIKAGLLTDWQFDCDQFRIPQTAFAAADLSHWLALDVAAAAIARAGGLTTLDRDRTAVIVANTLTGEFSRAALLRLRAPFLDEVLAEAIGAAGLAGDQAADLRLQFGTMLRARFPEPTEESLAGALANTIAGRIANHFDLRGGAYSIDGACASSLVAVADAANLLALGQVDAVLVGAVDLSLDPFELVGFSRNGALARDEMRVFDQRASGFWPGEGAAFLLLMREDEARRRGHFIRAVLRGWAISSDGAGGLTRPSVEGQLRALRRAHEMAGTDPADIGYVEAHGTGTAVGDAIEVTALARWRNGAARPLPIGSVKANIGHTKAAAGLAGLIKAVGALSNGYVPPHVGCTNPHRVFREVDGAIRPALEGEAWPTECPRLAGVSGFGFGGINAHVVLECNATPKLSIAAYLPHRVQDAELFVFSAPAGEMLVEQMTDLRNRLPALSLAEFTDVAAALARSPVSGPCRVALVAREPDELGRKLETAIAAIEAGRELIDAANGIHVARRLSPPRIGLLFPGQAAPARPNGGLWARRFDLARTTAAAIPQTSNDAVRTEIAQPAIAAASIVACRILQDFGLDASMATGHSLGELTALAWAGAIEDRELLRLAAARGAVIATHGRPGGGMLRIVAPHGKVAALIAGLDVTIACRNGPAETVVSGPSASIAIAAKRARDARLETTSLAVSHAFHSAMIEPARVPFIVALDGFAVGQVRRPLISTVTGDRLKAKDDLRDLLTRQLTAPVLFDAALRRLIVSCDLLIEAGPGAGLTRLACDAGALAISVDAFAESLAPLLSALGAAYALGAAPRLDRLFKDRPTRAVSRTAPKFLSNPCGRRARTDVAPAPIMIREPEHPVAKPVVCAADATDELALVTSAIAEATGFAADRVRPDDLFLDDLHLNSLAVSRIAAKAARLLSCSAPVLPGELVKGTPRVLAAALAERRQLGGEAEREPDRIQGIRPWLRPYAVHWVRGERPVAKRISSWRVLPIRPAADDHGPISAIAAHHGRPDGMLIWLGAAADETATFDLFAACRSAWADGAISRLAICHAGAPVAAFAHSLALEQRFGSVVVIDRSGMADATEFILGELDAAQAGFAEAKADAAGLRWVPQFVPATPPCRRDAAIGPDDVLLATGGAKGIGAECALRIALRFGVALILVGRTSADDPAITATLARAAASNIRCRYVAADVCDSAELSAAVAIAAADLGAVTVLLHAAGVNDPAPFETIADADLHRIMAPKTIGLRAAVAAAGPRLRRIITFGSLLGRMGLRGEAHYGIANAWQSAVAESFERGSCHVLSLEWSVWNGVGMGHQLGAVERLARLGVDALPVDAALDMLEALLRDGAVGTFMITSRFGPPPYISCGVPQLPLLRFVDNVLLHYPGVELVVETTLSRGRDLYLADHVIDGSAIFPAVMALEAMAQVACAMAGHTAPALVESIAFAQAIAIPDHEAARIRIVALADGNERIEVAIRTSEDSFAVDCMSAVFVFGTADPAEPIHASIGEPAPEIDASVLYGPLFFQGDRFRRIRSFTHLTARRIAALLSPQDNAACFSGFEPQQLVLGDPNVRDALLHALQAAAPHRRVIPISVGRIRFYAGKPPTRVDAVEREANDDVYQFDIVARDGSGAIVEYWQQVRFRAISSIDNIEEVLAAAPALIPVYVERVARAVLDNVSIEVTLACNRQVARDDRRGAALAALGLAGKVFSRSDGKPIVPAGEPHAMVSISHRDAVTLAVRAHGNITCDVERVCDWMDESLTSPLSSSMADLAAQIACDAELPAVTTARIWSLYEADAKQAQPSGRNWKAQRSPDGRVVLFETASGRTATIHIPGHDGGLVIAIASRTIDPMISSAVTARAYERVP